MSSDSNAGAMPDRDAANSNATQTSDPKFKLAWQSPAAWLRFLLPAFLGIVTDLWVKAYSFPDGVPAAKEAMKYAGRNPAGYPVQAIIPHILGFTTTVNEGAVFGSFQGYVSVFLAFSFVALAVILWLFVSSRANHWIVHIALGLITAGAIGNLFDRAIYHGVRDMFRFYVSWYPYIFNIADALLCIGVPLLILRWMFVKEDAPETTKI